jgi:uncharacterized membrane protein
MFEVLLVLLGLAVVFGPIILAIIAIMRTGELMARVQRLEASLKAIAQKETLAPQAALTPPADFIDAAPDPQASGASVQAARITPNVALTKPAPLQPPTSPSLGTHVPAETDVLDRLQGWLVKNWVYVVAGVSLGFAGIFFVQYGIEHGILSPTARVLSGGSFGVALIGAAVYLHRRSNDDGEGADVLPSVMVGAGFVSIFAATLAARQLYGLIGPELALVLHVIIALATIAFGWVFGPVLIGLGLAGGFIAPLIVGGGSDSPDFLYLYYVLLAAIGLGVDYLRRWGWVCVLALVFGYLGTAVVALGLGSEGGHIAALIALLTLATTLPSLRLWPNSQGSTASQALFLGAAKPVFAAQLAMGANLATVGFLVLIAMSSPQPTAWAVLALLALAYPFWMRAAPALADAAAIPSAALLGLLGAQVISPTALSLSFLAAWVAEVSAPLTVTLLLAAAAMLSLVFAYTARRGGALAQYFVYGAALYAPLAALLLDRGFRPAIVLGAYAWALHVMALAAMMVGLAYLFGQAGQRKGMAFAVLSALALIALAMVTVMSGPALTLALAVLIAAAAWLGNRFEMPEMARFANAALAAVSYRLLIAPGLLWAMDSPLLQVIFAFGGTLAAVLFARHFTDVRAATHRMTLETAALGLTAVLADIVILRALQNAAFDMDYVQFSLLALPWIVLSLTQAHRATAQPPLPFAHLHQAIAGMAGIFGAGLLAAAVVQSPLTSFDLVTGPFLLNSTFVAYAIPAIVLGAAGWKLIAGPALLRNGLIFLASGLATLYSILQIRRFWNGDLFLNLPIGQGELYTYTLALMILGAGLIQMAIRQHSEALRRAGMAVIAVTVAKVFLWDAAGLTGLTRVTSFAGLGLALLGIAQLTRWAARKTGGDGRA